MTNILLSILPILIYTTYSQQCSNTHNQAVVISISTNTRQVPKIGISTYLDIINTAVDNFLPTSSATRQTAVWNFAGVTQGGARVEEIWEQLSLGNNAYSAISTAILDLESNAGVNWDNNWGNEVSTMIDKAVELLDTTAYTNYQKYHIIFAAGNPLTNGQGETTGPANPNNPCGSARIAKAAGIQTYVALIGENGNNFVKNFYYCVTEKIEDVVVINPNTPTYTTLTNKLCKTSGYDAQITEINPSSITGYNAFIEILNRGASASMRACSGTTCSSYTTVGTGQYFVASVGGGVSGGVTASIGSVAGTTAGLNQDVTAQINGVGTVDTVSYSGGTGIPGRSLELRNIGYNNDYDKNFRAACANAIATPGSPPGECTSTDDSCGTDAVPGSNNCDIQSDVTSTTTACYESGGTPNYYYCVCVSGILGDIDTCIAPPAVSSGTCEAFVITAFDGKEWLYYAWNKPEWDDDVTYGVNYQINGNTKDVTDIGASPAYAVLDYRSGIIPGAFELKVTPRYTSPLRDNTVLGDQVTLTCDSSTVNPTTSPTIDPTAAPVRSPTDAPTLSPTFDNPGVYLTDICGPARCECFEADRGCCYPFGPQYGDDLVDDTAGGYAPSAGCGHNTKLITIEEATQFDLQQDFNWEVYPAGFAEQITIQYTIQAFGVINMSDFESLNFTETYLDDGVIPGYGLNTARRRTRRLLEIEELLIANHERHLLQNGSSTPSPVANTGGTSAPTTLYGNKLNIEVRPPGGATQFSGSVRIPGGVGAGGFTMNITTATLKCDVGDECVSNEECTSQGLAFALIASSCTSSGTNSAGASWTCSPLYPNILWIGVKRSDQLCGIIFGLVGGDNGLPDWIWWLLLALLIFLLILAWLVYRFWWKQKKTASELGDAEDELDQQQADNEAGFGKDLDVGDVAFNPMATGVPGMNRPADAFGNELHERQMQQQNDMVDVQAEIFQVRQDYGQVQTGPRHHQ